MPPILSQVYIWALWWDGLWMNNNKVRNVVASSPHSLSWPSSSWATETLVLVKMVWTALMVSWSGSVQFSHAVVSDSLRPHELQHARPPCPASSQTHVSTISSSVIPFSSCPQSFPGSGSFPVSQFFPSGGQRIGVSASASVLPMNIQNWFPLKLTGLISLQSRDSQESSPIPQFKSINSSVLSFLYSPTLISIQDYWKNHSFD